MILHINTSEEWRGGENQTLQLVQGLDALQVKQYLLLQPSSPLLEKVEKLNLSNLTILPIKMGSEWDWKAIQAIRKTIQENNIRLVHTHTANAHSLAFLAKKKKDAWKLIVSRRVDFPLRKNFYSQWKYRSPLVDMYVCVSQYIHKMLLQENIDPRKIITIHSGIDIQKFQKLPSKDIAKKQLGVGKKTILLGIIAALVDHKDYPTLLTSLSYLPKDLDFLLFILGEGELKDSLQNLAKQLEIQEKVRFLGFQPNIEKYLAAFDIFCFSSKEEGLGTSVLDAMACGLPIVATRAGGIPEMVVDGKGGYLVPIQNPEEFAAKIHILAQNENLRSAMGQFNKQHVSEFSIQKTIEKTFRLYYSYLGSDLSPLAPQWKPTNSRMSPRSMEPTHSSQSREKPKKREKSNKTKKPQPPTKYGKKN